MKLLAVVKAPKDPQGAREAVARVLGITLAEANMRLSAEAPALLTSLPDDDAERLAQALRAEKLAALTCPLPVPSEGRLTARTLALEPDAVTFEDRQGAQLRIPYGELKAILRGQQMVRTENATTQKVKQFSVTRAVITQGLSFSKTTERTVRSQAEEVTHFVRVYSASGAWAAVEDGQMAFACLGSDLQSTKLGNINKVVELLRSRAPGAVFDDRLLRLGRRPLPFTLAAPTTLREGKTATSRMDTSSSADVISYLLVAGLREGLLP